ncbi:3'-5'-exoribonuclease [Recurvomyces mirabilis]|nr:3'-5'-exoribonuclease [Recurvomyces mirabilis]
MPSEVTPSTNNHDFILIALRQNLRLDSRLLDAYRPIILTFPADPDTYGQADVRIGKTRVLCNVSCEVGAPYPDRKFDGVFTISCELGPMASPAWEVGRQDQTEIILSRILEKTVRRSGALDTESLCIVAGQKCFHLRADIHVLDHDGNVLDAACFALMAALLHFRRPDVSIEGEEVTVYSVREREPVKLTMTHHPFCITTSFYPSRQGSDDDLISVLDTTLQEEQCRTGSLTISLNRHGEVCNIAKYGGVGIEGLSVLTCVHASLEKAKMFDRLLKEKLAEDEKARQAKIGAMGLELSAENERVMERPVG